MGRQRRYIDDAERQAAYRERHEILSWPQRVERLQGRLNDLAQYHDLAWRIHIAAQTVQDQPGRRRGTPLETLTQIAEWYEGQGKLLQAMDEREAEEEAERNICNL